MSPLSRIAVLATTTALLAAAAPPALAAGPIAGFNWKTPDPTSQGWTDDMPDTSSRGQIVLNACVSSSRVKIEKYEWEITDTLAKPRVIDNGDACKLQLADRPFNGHWTVTLTVTDADGLSDKVTDDLPFKDVLVASIGDSAASGEGVPHPITGYVSRQCDRSTLAAQTQAAKRAADRLGDHGTLTYWNLACSGASIKRAGGSDPKEGKGGLLESFVGQNPVPGMPLLSQVQQLADLRAATAVKPKAAPSDGRPIDALLVTAGANDSGWGGMLEDCYWQNRLIKPGMCQDKWGGIVDSGIRNLVNAFNELAIGLWPLVESDHVHLVEYWDATHDESESGFKDYCGHDPAAPGPEDRKWGYEHGVVKLNERVHEAAHYLHYNVIGGIEAAFRNHGLCAADPWINSPEESFMKQGDFNGGWHANERGLQEIATIIDQSNALNFSVHAIKSVPQPYPLRIGIVSDENTGREVQTLDGALDAPWTKQRDAGDKFEIDGSRIGVLNTDGELFVREDDAEWIKVGPAKSRSKVVDSVKVQDFELEGERIGVLDENGTLSVSNGEIGAKPATVATDVADFELEGDRTGVLHSDGVFEAQQDGEIKYAHKGVTKFDLEGERTGILLDEDKKFLVREGSLDGDYQEISADVHDFQLEGDRIGYVLSDWALCIQDVEIVEHDCWSVMGEVTSFQLEGNRIAATQGGHPGLWVMEGPVGPGIDGHFERVSESVHGENDEERQHSTPAHETTDRRNYVLNGRRIAVVQDDGELLVKEGAIGAGWTKLAENVDSVQMISNLDSPSAQPPAPAPAPVPPTPTPTPSPAPPVATPAPPATTPAPPTKTPAPAPTAPPTTPPTTPPVIGPVIGPIRTIG